MLTIYGMTDSGNCYKPRLLLAKLGHPFRHVEVNSVSGETRSAAFRALNPNGKVPLLQFEDGRVLAESNAMLLHLAEGTRFLPSGGYERARTYEWLFFEQYSHEPYVAVRRALLRYRERAAQATPERMAALLEGGNQALAVMERQLERAPFLVAEAISVADLALFAYTQDARAAGYDLDRFPAVAAWLHRVVDDPGHVALDWLPPERATFAEFAA